jgi:hypothetical protein
MTDTAAPTATALAINDAVAIARNLPELIRHAQAIDPELAAALAGKALIASRTPWGVLLAAALAWGVAKYASWDETMTTLVAGLGIVAGGYVMRYISPARITGILSAPVPSSVTTPPPTAAPRSPPLGRKVP